MNLEGAFAITKQGEVTRSPGELRLEEGHGRGGGLCGLASLSAISCQDGARQR